jgi:AraC-like DNA-binding protein
MRNRHSWAMLHEHRLDVADALLPWIADVTESAATAPLVITEAPDHATSLTLRRSNEGEFQAIVVGPRTRALHYEGGPGVSCRRARLRPGRAKFLFGTAVSGLVDRAVPLAEIWDSAPAPAILWHDPDAFARALEAAVPGEPDDFLDRAAETLPAVGVRASAELLHVSERHLRSLTVRGTGLSPKRYARIDRVRQVLARGPGPSWSRLALAIGYADHSHLTAEFRTMMGMPPTAYFAGAVAPNTRCRGPFDDA